MLSRLALVVVTLGFALKPTWSATIELTGRSVDGHTLGVKIEGEIEPGDAAKVLAIYKYFGPAATSNVFLWSRGGDADEAMKIGGIIRRLRLETWAPDRLHLFRMLGQFGVHAAPASKENNICASACVLLWAAGAARQGDLLVLHRPFVVPKVGSRVSDIEFENAEKEVIATTHEYLKEMEFPTYYIEKMIATSSQDGYVPTEKDLEEYPLEGIPPSIEEIILSKCESLSASEAEKLGEALMDKFGATTTKRKATSDKLYQKLWDKSTVYRECASKELINLRVAAWSRENETTANHKCALKEGNSDAAKSNMEVCRRRVIDALTYEALDRGFHAKPGDTPPVEFSTDSSMFDEK